MQRPKSPCIGCEIRHMRCHSTCKEYLDFQSENEIYRENSYQKRLLNSRLESQKYERYRKTNKGGRY